MSERHLIRGDDAAAERLWRGFIDDTFRDRGRLLAGAQVMSEMGLDALAIEAVERHQRAYGADLDMLQFLFDLHRQRGNTPAAEQVLARMDEVLPPAAAGRAELAENYARLNLPEKALEVWGALERAAGGLDYAGNLRVAALQAAAGQTMQALETWRKLWRQAASPARREFVQERLIAAAQAQNRLQALAAELETSLAAGKGGLPEARLLVSVRVKAGEVSAASDTIERLFPGFGVGAVDVLEELARVYRTAGMPEQFVRVQRRLMKADPGNASAYMRAIVLQRIEQPGPDKETELDKLLAEWRTLDGARVDLGFEAGVLMRANLLDRAIDVYKQAIAADPGERDNYLLIAEALKKRNRRPEAVALLRKLATAAPDDELFLTAIDGLLNTVTGMPGNPLEPAAVEQIEWARGRVSARMERGGKELWMYQLLMDIDDELSDAEGYKAAAEGAMSVAPGQRGAILRQLLAVTAPQERPMPQMGLHIDDAQLHLDYGRRLMELGGALPPDVYLDLGKAFLENADPQGAARAFGLAIGTTGRADLMQQAAELYDSLGYPKQAVDMLTRGYIRARGDTGIALQLARLNERAGERERAHKLYAQTLRALVLRQPAVPGQALWVDPFGGNRKPNPLDGKPVTREFRDMYGPLVAGYLATWPKDEVEQRNQIEALEKLLDEGLEAAASGKWRPYSRADLAARLVRRVAFAAHDAALAARVDGRLRERFGAAAAQAPAPRRKPGSFVQAANAAWLGGEQERMLAALRDWARSGGYRQALAWADGKLDARRYRLFAREVLALTRADAPFMQRPLLDSSGGNARFLLRLETAADEPVFSARELLAMLMRFDELTELERSSISATPYLMGKLSTRDVLEWLRYAAQPAHKPMTYMQALQFWQRLLSGPVEPGAAAQLGRLMDDILTDNKSVDLRGADFVSDQLLVTGINQENIALSRAVTDAWRGRINQTVDYYQPAYLLKEGRTPEALDAFLSLPAAANGGADSNLRRRLQELFLPRYADEIRQRLGHQDPDKARASIDRQLQAASSGLPAQARIVSLLETAVAMFPDDAEYLARLATAYTGARRMRDAAAALEKLHRLDPDNLGYRVSLYQAWVRNGNFLRALELKRATPQDLRDPKLLAGLQQRAMRQGGQGMPPIAGGVPRMFGAINRVNDRAAQLAKDMEAGNSGAVAGGLRTVWYLAATDESSSLDRLLAMNLSGPAGRKLFDAVSEQPAAVEALEDFLRALDAGERQELYPLAGFLAKAYLNNGLAEEKAASLQRIIERGAASDSDLTVWLSLQAGEKGAPPAAALGLLHEFAREPERLSHDQLLPLARALARTGDLDRAAALYRFLACGLLVAGTHGGAPVTGRVGYEGILTATQFMEEIGRTLDEPRRSALERDVVKLAAPPADASTSMWQRYREFVLQVAAGSADAVRAWPVYRDRVGLPAAEWSGEMLTSLTALQARAGDLTAAAETLELLATRDGAVDFAPFIPRLTEGSDFATESEYMGMLGLSMSFQGGPRAAAGIDRMFSGAGPRWSTAAAAKLEQLLSRGGNQDALFSMLMAADAAGLPLHTGTRAALLRGGRVEPTKVANLVQRIADGGDVEQALELGGEATGYTQDDALLAVLEKLASDAGDAEQARRWQTLRVAAREAAEALNAR